MSRFVLLEPIEVAAGMRLVLSARRARGRRHVLDRVMPDGSRRSMEAIPFKPVPEVPDRAEYVLRAGFTMKAGEEFELGSGQDIGRILGRGAAVKLKPADRAGEDEFARLVEASKPKPKKVITSHLPKSEVKPAKAPDPVAEAVETLVAGKPQEPGQVVATAGNPSIVERPTGKAQDGKRR